MKTMTLPKELLNLPCPWGMTHWMQRHEQIQTLSYNPSDVKTALNVLERCLCALLQLHLSSGDSIPEDMIQYWDFSAALLARKMPHLDQFEMLKVKEFLIQYGIESPSPILIFDVALYWLWGVTQDICEATLRWLQDDLRGRQESVQALCFLRIVDRYYWQVDEPMKGSLLLASASIGWQKALPLLECVQQNSSSSPQLRQSARDYQQWILGSNGKREDKRKNETNHFVQRITQLA